MWYPLPKDVGNGPGHILDCLVDQMEITKFGILESLERSHGKGKKAKERFWVCLLPRHWL